MGTYQDAGTRCASGPQPGTVAIYRHVLDSPTWPEASGLGIYVCRTKRGGSSLSLHAEGRAFDFGFPQDDDGIAEGWRLYQLLKAQAEVLGLQRLLYRDKAWRTDRGDYTPSKTLAAMHMDHIHGEQTWDGARNLTAEAVARIFNEPIPDAAYMLRQGDTSAPVQRVQQKLAALGYDVPITGVFEISTDQAVRAFQQAKGLGADGIVGPATHAKLDDIVVLPPAEPAKTPTEQVQDWYSDTFGRAPTGDDLRFWSNQITVVGSTVAKARFDAAAETESADNTKTPAERVAEWYDAELERNPTADETKFWVGQIAAVGVDAARARHAAAAVNERATDRPAPIIVTPAPAAGRGPITAEEVAEAITPALVELLDDI